MQTQRRKRVKELLQEIREDRARRVRAHARYFDDLMEYRKRVRSEFSYKNAPKPPTVAKSPYSNSGYSQPPGPVLFFSILLVIACFFTIVTGIVLIFV